MLISRSHLDLYFQALLLQLIPHRHYLHLHLKLPTLWLQRRRMGRLISQSHLGLCLPGRHQLHQHLKHHSHLQVLLKNHQSPRARTPLMLVKIPKNLNHLDHFSLVLPLRLSVRSQHFHRLPILTTSLHPNRPNIKLPQHLKPSPISSRPRSPSLSHRILPLLLRTSSRPQPPHRLLHLPLLSLDPKFPNQLHRLLPSLRLRSLHLHLHLFRNKLQAYTRLTLVKSAKKSRTCVR